MTTPILYSFRRCPYAMRARMALHEAAITVEIREVELNNKAEEFVTVSPKATVPVLALGEKVLEESLDIMLWALRNNDPSNWLLIPDAGFELIDEADNEFKPALDHYKYSTHYEDEDGIAARQNGMVFLGKLDALLEGSDHLFAGQTSIADIAIFPFVRQFASVDKNWFNNQPWPNVIRWLNFALNSANFQAVMQKYPRWTAGDPITLFPGNPDS
ncbi:MAG: glutathione S-transferase [Parasphingorhabdus sp.]